MQNYTTKLDITNISSGGNAMKREFYIDTPLGQLKVWAKHETDNAEDFPGVFIDLVCEDGAEDMLACVEYESVGGVLQTCVYQPGIDEPVSIVRHTEFED
jgi:hypothetical protein